MTSSRIDRQRLAELFEQALAVAPAERSVFLDTACGTDGALRAELASLLASHVAAPHYLDDLGARILPAALEALAEEDDLARQRVAGRYDIMERIAVGGMGVVYKARDVSLDRPVALKFLPLHLTADSVARDRLRREARAVSALDHPNIAVVYEIGSIGAAADDPQSGRLFIAMAYYHGETLEQKISRGPLSIAEAVDHAAQIADGLSRAHRAGIVHRDIKPANILITDDDRIRILDFGVARVSDAALTGERTLLGTVAYMSPEQTRGAGTDERTDVWSVGVVLYEMLTGVRPFRGEIDEAVMHGIRHDQPTPLPSLRPDVTPELARIVDRCLSKDAALRYPNAGELHAALRSPPAAGPPPVAASAMVVLPFVNISEDRENEYFSDGLTEEVIAGLSRIRALKVISRTSAMRFKRSDKDVRTIARELGVRYVLEGGVRKAGAALRITVRFVDAHADQQLWTHTFAGTLADIFEIQEHVARAIVDALRIRLSSGEAQLLSDRPIPDARAYEPYLRARYEAWRFSRDGLERAQRYIDTALGIVGDNELLYSTLGHITAGYVEAGLDASGAARDDVDALADKVFALNPDSARGHFLKAFVAFHRGDMPGAIRAGERAHALEPRDPDTLLLLTYINALIGRNGTAHSLSRQSLELDPLTPLTHAVQGFLALVEGRFADSLEPYRRCYEMDPDSPFATVCFGLALGYDDRIDEAGAVLDEARTHFPDTAFGAWANALAHALRGNLVDVVPAITPVLQAAGRRSEMFARAIAQCCALAGEKSLALDWIERQIGLGMLNYEFLARHDRFLNGVRDEPRFRELLRRVEAASAALD